MIRIKTQSGSTYLINVMSNTWERVRKPNIEGPDKLRTLSGSYDKISRIDVGHPMRIWAKPLDPNKLIRLIETSPVMSVDSDN